MKTTQDVTGLVKKIEYCNITYPASNPSPRCENKELKGIVLFIESDDRIEWMEFPENIHITERNKLLGRNVIYHNETYSYTEPGFLSVKEWNYEIEVIDGPNKGKKLEKRVVA